MLSSLNTPIEMRYQADGPLAGSYLEIASLGDGCELCACG